MQFLRRPKKNPELEERLSHLRSSRHRPLGATDPRQTPETSPSTAEEHETVERSMEETPLSEAGSRPENVEKTAFSAMEGVGARPGFEKSAPGGYTRDFPSQNFHALENLSSAPSLPISEQKGDQPNMEPVRREHLPYPDLAEPARVSPGQPDRRGEGTRIDRQSHLNGTLRSDGDIYIEGTIEGEIECAGTVYIEENATVSATVQARSVVVAGHANGDFTCEERLVIKASGEMKGKAQAAALIVEEGAFFEGEFKMATSSLGATSFGAWNRSEMKSAVSQDEEGV